MKQRLVALLAVVVVSLAAPYLGIAIGAWMGMGQAATVALFEGGWGTALSVGVGIAGILAVLRHVGRPMVDAWVTTARKEMMQ